MRLRLPFCRYHYRKIYMTRLAFHTRFASNSRDLSSQVFENFVSSGGTMVRKTKLAGSESPPLEEFASKYRVEQARHNHRGIYRIDYYALYPLVNDPALTILDIGRRLRLARQDRKDIIAVARQFFPFSGRALQRTVEPQSRNENAEDRRLMERTRVFPLIHRYFEQVELAHLLVPISARPSILDLDGVRCGAWLTTTVYAPHGNPYAHWVIPNVDEVDFAIFIAAIEDERTPFREIYCIPRDQVPNTRYIHVRLGQRRHQYPNLLDLEPYRGHRGLLLLKQAVDTHTQ
jgi:hypothetical protein